jgi:hypothetical protein
MDQYGLRDPGVHEGSTLLSTRQSAIASDELVSDGIQTPPVDVDSSPSRNPWKEFERRRQSARFYLNQYLVSWDRISQTCPIDNTDTATALSNQSESQTRRDLARLKICTDTAIRDLRVMENILTFTKEKPNLQPQPLSSAAFICTCALFISAAISPLKVAILLWGMGAAVGSKLAVPRIWQCVQCYHIGIALSNVKDLRESFSRGTIGRRNWHDLESWQFSMVKRTISEYSREVGNS